jgi:hypothetical protein
MCWRFQNTDLCSNAVYLCINVVTYSIASPTINVDVATIYLRLKESKRNQHCLQLRHCNQHCLQTFDQATSRLQNRPISSFLLRGSVTSSTRPSKSLSGKESSGYRGEPCTGARPHISVNLLPADDARPISSLREQRWWETVS